MKCPKCNHPVSRVTHTVKRDSGITYRRRKCKLCKMTWHTHEYQVDIDEIAKHEPIKYEPAKPEPNNRTSVYFIICQELSLVKIGYAWDVMRRLGNLRSASPLPLELYTTLSGSAAIDAQSMEQKLHERFARQRQRGEWFLMDSELSAFLDGLKDAKFRANIDWG